MPKKRPSTAAMIAEIAKTTRKTAEHVDFLINHVQVNGSKGAEAIWRDHHQKLTKVEKDNEAQTTAINELKDVTQSIRSRSYLRKAWSLYLKDRPLLKGLINIVTSKRVLLPIVGILLSWIGYHDGAGILEIFKSLLK